MLGRWHHQSFNLTTFQRYEISMLLFFYSSPSVRHSVIATEILLVNVENITWISTLSCLCLLWSSPFDYRWGQWIRCNISPMIMVYCRKKYLFIIFRQGLTIQCGLALNLLWLGWSAASQVLELQIDMCHRTWLKEEVEGIFRCNASPKLVDFEWTLFRHSKDLYKGYEIFLRRKALHYRHWQSKQYINYEAGYSLGTAAQEMNLADSPR